MSYINLIKRKNSYAYHVKIRFHSDIFGWRKLPLRFIYPSFTDHEKQVNEYKVETSKDILRNYIFYVLKNIVVSISNN